MSVVHLNAHSHFSLMRALPAPEELARTAALHAMPALALTERDCLTGSVAFVQACRAAGVKPVLGLEFSLDLPHGGILALLAADGSGWQSLCRLATQLGMQGDESGLTLEQVAAHSQGLIALTGGRDGAVDRTLEAGGEEQALALLDDLVSIFPGSLYVSLEKGAGEDDRRLLQIQGLAEQLRLPVVASNAIYAIAPDESPLLRTLTAMRLNRPLAAIPAAMFPRTDVHFLSPEEMAQRYEHFPVALRNTLEVAERCTLDLPLGEPHYPQPPLPPGVTALQLLRQKAEAGACRLYGKMTQEVQARLDHELEIIGRRGYETIFLIMEDILAYARRSGVPVSSRGSAASSLVAHCLGITTPDPLRLDLYFERFLNPARATPPDIDTDICSRRRDQVIDYVFEAYGRERVAMVGTINRFRPRSALGEVAKAHGLAPAAVRELVERLPRHFFHHSMNDEDAPEIKAPFAELIQAYASPNYQRIFKEAMAILRLPRHLSVHAGGIVIAPQPLTELVPLQRSGSKGIMITQFDLKAVEAFGLVKLDLLGIRGLTVLGDVAEFIYTRDRKPYNTRLDVLDSIPPEDTITSDRVEAGGTIGCFQIESPGMRATLRDIRARTPDDIMAALALYRPGPLQGGQRDAFVRRFKGEEPVSYLHPALEPLLQDTYGVILYQEQVLRLAHGLAGFSLTDADLLRRAMSHFDPGKQMQVLQQKFIAAAGEMRAIPADIAAQLWDMMAAFAGYGFPKAHAASYAQIGWRSAWCKTHFPAEFMAAVLANWGGYYSQRVYLSEARRMGLVVKPPHVNYSQREFSVDYSSGAAVLYMGLDQVRELTRRIQDRILQGRPFSSLEDFLARADPRPQEAENLALAGAFEGFGAAPELLRRIRGGGWRLGQLPLFSEESMGELDWTLDQKAAAQYTVLGISPETHPLELVADRIASSGAVTTLQAAGMIGKRVSVAGVRQTWHRARTARGESMGFLTLEDLEGTLDVIFFPDIYHRARPVLSGSGPLLISGVVENDPDRGEPLIRAEKVEQL